MTINTHMYARYCHHSASRIMIIRRDGIVAYILQNVNTNQARLIIPDVTQTTICCIFSEQARDVQLRLASAEGKCRL